MPNPFLPGNFNCNTTRWDPKNALAMALASDLAYQDAKTIINTAALWGLGTAGAPAAVIGGPRDIQAYVAGNAQFIIVVFRGTITEQNGVITADNWMVDMEANQVSVEESFGVGGGVHDGFASALSSIWQPIQDAVDVLQTGAQSVWFAGHSLGGSLALLAAAAWTFELRQPFNGLYTFGQPRVGDLNFCGNCDTHFGGQYFRFVNNEDIVTRVPPRLFPHFPLPDVYGHCGQLVFFDAQGDMHDDDHYWNNFLASVEVGYESMVGMLTAAPIKDHNIDTGYIANINKYIAGGCAPPMAW